MKTLNLTLDDAPQKLYLKIAGAIRTAITNGHVAADEPLPSARTLAAQLSVNRHTIMAAYHELVAQGWVETTQRQGYSVVKTLPVYAPLKSKKQPKQDVKQHQWRLAKADDSPCLTPASQYLFNFAGGTPDIELFPFNTFRGYMNDALKRPLIEQLNYGQQQGFSPFIKEVSTYLRRVRSISDKEIIVVNGTQEALYLIAQVLLTTGDKVAVESLGYRPAWTAFESAGAQLIGVKQTEKGIDVEHLESLLKQHKIRLLYLTPLHQYPTTTTLPLLQRNKVYQLAQQYNVPIIEDDYDHEFHYDSQPLAPMAATDPAGLIIYLASFSKIMFPGMRLGIIAVDKSLSAHLINYRTHINHKVNVPLQDAVARWMRDGAFESHLRKATRLYQKRRAAIIEVLNGFSEEGLQLEFTVPAGGMALWVNVGKNAQKIARLARAQGIFILAEETFHLTPETNQNKFLRFGFAGQSEAKMQQGLLLLKSIIQSQQ